MTLSIRWIGDKFIFSVAYKDINGLPIALDSVAAIPQADVYLGKRSNVSLQCTLANNKATIVDGPNGLVTFKLNYQDYAALSGVPPKDDTVTVYNRLRAYILGTDGQALTYVVTEIPVIDPQTGDLDTQSSRSVVAIIGPQGPQGVPGVPGIAGGSSGVGYVYSQPTVSTVWTIHHNLSRYPSITLIDTAGDTMGAAINYNNDNTVVVTFSAPTAGSAFCN